MPKNSRLFLVTFLALSLSGVFGLLSLDVYAGQAGDSYLRFSRMVESEDPGDVLVVFTTSADVGTDAKFKITLDSEFVATTNFSTTAGDWTFTTTGIPGSSTAMPISGSNASGISGNTVTFDLTGTLDTSTEYAFIITGGFLANPTASTSIVHTLFTTTSGDVTIDTIDIASPTISDDQVVINAAVPPAFTFVFGGNSDDLGVLSTSAVNSGSGNTITVTTNAANGWIAWALSANQGLDSTVLSYTIPTTGAVNGAPSSLSAGTEGYLLDVDLTTDAASGGTVTIAAEYNGADTSSGGTLSATFEQIASADGTANGDIITLIPRVAIAGQTPAANDYTDTLTIVGAGIF